MSEILLKDLCLENCCGIYGIPAIAEEYDEKKTRYLRITDISEDGCLLNSDLKSVSSENIEKYILNEGDIVFARTGNSTGKTYYHDKKNGQLAFAGFLIKYSLDPKKSNPKYLRYFTISNEYRTWVSNLSLGSTRGNINAQTFSNLPITLPTRVQQDTLVKILSALDAKIELNNRINTELEAMAKTLYDYWFVQFDFPILKEQAKAMGKPELTGKPYKSSGGKMVYDDTLKREIPEGWKADNILADAALLGGGTPRKKKEQYWKGDIPFFTPTDADLNVFKISTADYITSEGLKNCSSMLFDKGTVFITARGSVGKLSIVANEMAMNQSCYALKAKKGIGYSYLYYTAMLLIHHLKVKSSGSVFNSIVSNDIKYTILVIPPTVQIKNYSEKVTDVFESILLNTKQNQQLTQLRDWLLPMLMNGQVSVK